MEQPHLNIGTAGTLYRFLRDLKTEFQPQNNLRRQCRLLGLILSLILGLQVSKPIQ